MATVQQYIAGLIVTIALNRSSNEPIERAVVTWKEPDGTITEFASDDSEPAVVVDSATQITFTVPGALTQSRQACEVQAYLHVANDRVIPSTVARVHLHKSNAVA